MLIGDKGTTTLLYARYDWRKHDDEGGMGVELWRCDLGQKIRYILSRRFEVVNVAEPDSLAVLDEHEVGTVGAWLGSGGNDDARMIHMAVEAYEDTWQMWRERDDYHRRLWQKLDEAASCDSAQE